MAFIIANRTLLIRRHWARPFAPFFDIVVIHAKTAPRATTGEDRASRRALLVRGAILWRSLAVYFQNFGLITHVTLVGYAPLKFIVFFACQQAGVAPGGAAASIIRDFADGILG